MPALSPLDEAGTLEVVRKVVSRELPPGTSLPGDDEDLIKTGAIDSMGWVGILSGIEEATGLREFATSWAEGRVPSIRALVGAIHEALQKDVGSAVRQEGRDTFGSGLPPSIVGWGYALGSHRVAATSIEAELGLPAGTLHEHAGIVSVTQAAGTETEVTLGLKAAQQALEMAETEPEAVDVLVLTSATFVGFPSLAALLHTRLLLRESSGAFDIGGACVGLIHALATAKGLLAGHRYRTALVVAAEVNSRSLCAPGVPGAFRGLFGDGAAAFVLSCLGRPDEKAIRLGDFIMGCSGAYASSLRLEFGGKGELNVDFKGEQLASAAVSTINQVIRRLEDLSSTRRAEVEWFALHEPNPRIVDIFAQRASIPLDKITRTCGTSGNLGSATCGVNLCTALTRCEGTSGHTIFAAAVGPGLLWAGTWLH
jgi:3-oxoacyl-[acyl-carrier-protein] synthase-3